MSHAKFGGNYTIVKPQTEGCHQYDGIMKPKNRSCLYTSICQKNQDIDVHQHNVIYIANLLWGRGGGSYRLIRVLNVYHA